MNKAFEKIKVASAEIVVHGTYEKPYYEIRYYDISDGKYHIGYSSYDLSIVFGWLKECFEIVQEVAEEYTSTEHINCSTNTSTDTSTNGWIPCSERLPKERDWYLAVFEEVDTGFIGIPYIADYLMGSHTKFTTEDGWIIRNCSDREDESAEYYKNLRCVAWQPLPQHYKESE